MTSYLEYRSQKLMSLLLTFSPDEEFRVILDSFKDITYPPISVNPELISFALLELVSNSIRAHRERGVTEAVKVKLSIEDGEFRATVQNSGRGFDPTLLPYDINSKPETVDVMSDSFAAYRQQFGGSRFGMGLYVAKKTFADFRLGFVDGAENPCPWFSGTVKGTKIDLSLPLLDSDAAMADSGRASAVEDLEEAEA